MTSWIPKKGKHVLMLSTDSSVVPGETDKQENGNDDQDSESQKVFYM